MSKTVAKSVGAVVAGFVAVFVLSVVTDLILEKIGVFPPQTQPELYVDWMLMVALIYRCAYTVFGAYLTARLAPNKPMKHVFILGGIGFVLATLGAIANWGKSAEWYPIALVISTVPTIWLGGKLANRR